jgi:hypothetical protein
LTRLPPLFKSAMNAVLKGNDLPPISEADIKENKDTVSGFDEAYNLGHAASGLLTITSGGGVSTGTATVTLVPNIMYADGTATEEQATGTGKGKNNLKPDPNAEGYPHSTFKTDPETGKITNYEIYKSNPQNPSTGVERVIRYDGQGQKHINKKTGEKVETPHVHDKSVPGGVRKPYPYEVPK